MTDVVLLIFDKTSAFRAVLLIIGSSPTLKFILAKGPQSPRDLPNNKTKTPNVAPVIVPVVIKVVFANKLALLIF